MAASKRKSPGVRAGVAGIGGGTTLLGLAQHIPASAGVWRDVAVYAAPTATVALAYLSSLCASLFTGWARRLQIHIALGRARKQRDRILKDPMSTNDLKSKAIENVERFEALLMEIGLDETNSIVADLGE